MLRKSGGLVDAPGGWLAAAKGKYTLHGLLICRAIELLDASSSLGGLLSPVPGSGAAVGDAPGIVAWDGHEQARPGAVRLEERRDEGVSSHGAWPAFDGSWKPGDFEEVR